MGTKELGDITIASIQSLANYKGDFDFDVVIVDESHKIPLPSIDSQYKKVLKKLNCQILGFTATPYRLKQGLIYGKNRWFERMDFEISIAELISRGFLVPFIHKVTRQLDLKHIKTGSDGDYKLGQLGDEMSKPVYLDSMKNDIEKYAGDRRSIVIFCTTIAHADLVCEMLGESAVMIHSQLSDFEKDEAYRKFSSGEARFMVNVNVLTEGWDEPRADCVLLARPTQSPALYVQMVGRGLRLSPETGKKDCLILDLANNGREHGRVTNVYVSDVVEDQGKKKEAKDKICVECLELNPPGTMVCVHCGFDMREKVELIAEAQTYEMEELKAEYWEAYQGSAEFSKTRAGADCIIVNIWVRRGGKEKFIKHYYMRSWNLGPTFKRIVNRFTSYDASEMNEERFVNGINAGKLFPIQEVEIYKDKGKYWKVRGF